MAGNGRLRPSWNIQRTLASDSRHDAHGGACSYYRGRLHESIRRDEVLDSQLGNAPAGYSGGDQIHGGNCIRPTTGNEGLLGFTDAIGWTTGMRLPTIEKADGRSKRGDAYHQFLKRRKNRSERRRARENPECIPAYGRYKGWET